MKLNTSLLLITIFYVSISLAESIEEKLLSVLPQNAEIESIEESVIEGLYKVYFGDLQPLYVSRSGDYFIYGDLYKIDDGNVKNLSLLDVNNKRKEILSDLPNNDFIEFKSQNEEYFVYVFTDVDCGFCKKFHSQISEYNNLGISVKYAAFPRSGIDGETYNKMVSVWCSEDRNAALSSTKSSESVESIFCTNQPVSKHYNLGQLLGVTGTPAIFTQTGSHIKGYVPPEDLLKRIKG